MSRLIDADALIKDLDKGLWGKDYDKALAETIIRDAPTIEPKQGEWIWNQYDGNPAIGNYHCSICRRLVPHDKYAFCPNCGAKMKGADDELQTSR